MLILGLFMAVRGVASVTKRLGPRAIPDAAEARLIEIVEDLEVQAKGNIRGSRTRARRAGRPVSAAPDELAVDTGNLQQSIKGVVQRKMKELVGTVGPQRVPYGAVHELGLRGMPKRPFLAPALERMKDRIADELGDAIGEVL
jgi:phage gpG-like protein